MIIVSDNFKGKMILSCTKNEAKPLSMGNRHVQRSAGALLFNFSCHVSTSNHQIELY